MDRGCFSCLKAPSHLKQGHNSLTLPEVSPFHYFQPLSLPEEGGNVQYGGRGRERGDRFKLGKILTEELTGDDSVTHSLCPVFHELAAKEPISTQLLVYFQTVLHKASRLSLTNLDALIYSRERSCRGMCWQTHKPMASVTISK